MDSLNYILYKKDVKKLFKNVHNYLNPGGLFIFDINTPYKFKNIFKNNVFYDVSDEITYIWQNSYDPATGICTFDLTFFVRESGELYRRLEEEQQQRAWSFEEIKAALGESGLKLIDILEQYTLNPPDEKSERCFFVVSA